jgi:hypothetical protein
MARHRNNARAARPTLAPLPSLAPPQVQIATGKVAQAEWVDPDASPRGPAKTVRHFRVYDPIRRMTERLHGSPVTHLHLAACERLRGLWDMAWIGLTGCSQMKWQFSEPSNETPTTPTRASVLQARAHARLQKCLKLFTLDQQQLIHHVVLLCRPLAHWRREHGHCCWATANKRLVEVLDRLVVYFKSEIARFGLPA